MKTIIKVTLCFFIFVNTLFAQWIETETEYPNRITDLSFLNSNTGYAITARLGTTAQTYLLKTTNKGNSWNLVYIFYDYSEKNSIDFVTEFIGYCATNNKVYKTINGGISWIEINSFYHSNQYPRIRFGNANTGYLAYSKFYNGTPGSGGIYFYKTTDGGSNWISTSISGRFTNAESRISDIYVSKSNPLLVSVCGFQKINNQYYSVYYASSNGFETSQQSDNPIANVRFDRISISPVNNDIYILSNAGIYKENNLVYQFMESDFSEQVGINIDSSGIGYAVTNGSNIYKTNNNGLNWFHVTYYTGSQFSDSRVINFNDIVYAGTKNGKIVSSVLNTYLNTYYNNISTPGSFSFDDVSYNTPSQQYLRGGHSKLNSSLIINPNQSDEKIFYKWNGGSMVDSNYSFYFDKSGTTIANYYKTKQLSESPAAISNTSQTKSVRDTTIGGVTATHTIHESMGGIFYSKSVDFGVTYKSEEKVNYNITSDAGDGNKNASLVVMRKSGNPNPITLFDSNRNVAVVWEKYNSYTEKIEIKLAHRILNAQQDGYEWQQYNRGGFDYVTAFDAPSWFESKPTCYVIADPSNLQNFNTLTLVIPHLRPDGKLYTSVWHNSIGQDYELDNGDINSLSTSGLYHYYNDYPVHYTYLKNGKVAYRKEIFGFSGSNVHRVSNPEVNNDVSSGDGYSSRFKPDISLMNNVPVVSYAASFNANVYVEYEGGGTDLVPVSRYPIVKVQRINNTSWGNYVIYNSNSVQQTPDIEGSNSTLSYIINYSLGNGQFKKIVNVSDYPGYLCQPNMFSGTDSRLVKNSYSGHFGNNLSLLTLSPQNTLQKVDKQNFVITNITSSDSYDVDNIDGVVNLDTIKYSFKLGPILIKEPNGEVEGGTFGIEQAENEQILTGVEFNENLKSYPFLLNETQALLLGCNATYIKDNAYSSISSVPYTVNLYNKSTGLLHRTLFQDTIHGEDSIETEFLRGFFITNIPNGEDSFYVKLEPDNSFDDGNFYINPVYDVEDNGDNPNGYNVAVIFEENKFESHSENIPQEFSLHQNFPNPFNPSTVIKYDLPKEGFVKIKIYDLTGREIRSLINEFKQAGSYSTIFNGADLSSGVYFYKLETENFRQIKRMVLLK